MLVWPVCIGKSCLMLDIVWSALEACDTRHLSITRCEACHGSLVGLVARTRCIGADSEYECDPTGESVTVWDLSCSWLECVRIPKPKRAVWRIALSRSLTRIHERSARVSSLRK
uniref:Uncharacterized protein n=1 Tax=Ananas comosus var. bracteatus TaxID=296719 RepID=A0A6V7PL93_ANACO|nr:unnamed protein product [Ananas comosus var. bracteatus]